MLPSGDQGCLMQGRRHLQQTGYDHRSNVNRQVRDNVFDFSHSTYRTHALRKQFNAYQKMGEFFVE